MRIGRSIFEVEDLGQIHFYIGDGGFWNSVQVDKIREEFGVDSRVRTKERVHHSRLHVRPHASNAW